MALPPESLPKQDDLSLSAADKRLAQAKGAVAIAFCAILWSTAGLFIKIIDWHPFAIAGIRSIVASVVLLAWLRRPRFHWSWAQVGAGLANAATMLLFVIANKTTTAANAILLQYVFPVWTALIGSVLLREKVHIEQIVAFILVAAGILIIFMDRMGGGSMFGNILASLSSVTFALYFVLMRKQKDGSPLESSLLSHWITASICIVASLFLPLPRFTVGSSAAVLFLGVVQIGLASILFAAGIKHVPAVGASLIAAIEPVFNPLWVFLAIGEAPGANVLIGGCLIIVAVSLTSVMGARRRT